MFHVHNKKFLVEHMKVFTAISSIASLDYLLIKTRERPGADNCSKKDHSAFELVENPK